MSLVESFLGAGKAKVAIASQLARCNATPESLTPNDVSRILNYLCGATKIHLAGNKAKQDELDAKLRAFEREGRSRPKSAESRTPGPDVTGRPVSS